MKVIAGFPGIFPGSASTERQNAVFPRLSYDGNANNYQESTFWLRNARYRVWKMLNSDILCRISWPANGWWKMSVSILSEIIWRFGISSNGGIRNWIAVTGPNTRFRKTWPSALRWISNIKLNNMKKYILYILVGIASWGIGLLQRFSGCRSIFQRLVSAGFRLHQTKYDRTMVVESVFPSGC